MTSEFYGQMEASFSHEKVYWILVLIMCYLYVMVVAYLENVHILYTSSIKYVLK